MTATVTVTAIGGEDELAPTSKLIMSIEWFTVRVDRSNQAKRLAELHRTGNTRKISADRIRKCARILQLLEAASRPEDMDVVGLHFHALQGTPKVWSVRVTANYRITFGWFGESAIDIDVEDYH